MCSCLSFLPSRPTARPHSRALRRGGRQSRRFFVTVGPPTDAFLENRRNTPRKRLAVREGYILAPFRMEIGRLLRARRIFEKGSCFDSSPLRFFAMSHHSGRKSPPPTALHPLSSTQLNTRRRSARTRTRLPLPSTPRRGFATSRAAFDATHVVSRARPRHAPPAARPAPRARVRGCSPRRPPPRRL
jgi:hypothetical protein